MPVAVTLSGPISYDTGGPEDAPVLLLSNSLGTTRSLWAPQMPEWSRQFRVIRYDTRGHGASVVAPEPYRLADLGADAIAVLDTCGVTRANVCGISLGGMTAMWLGIFAPDRVDKLVLANTAARIGTIESWNARMAQVRAEGMRPIAEQSRARWFTATFASAQPALAENILDTLARCDATGYLGCCAALRDADLRQDLRRINAPTLVVVGTHDPATPAAEGLAIRDGVAGASLVELDAAHLSNIEQAQAFTAAVTAFLRRE